MIQECLINIECKVVQVLDYDVNEGIIGEVVNSYVDPSVLEDGKINFRKVDPVLWTTGGDYSYYSLGERLKNT